MKEDRRDSRDMENILISTYTYPTENGVQPIKVVSTGQ